MLTVFGASRSSWAASATVMPGRAAASRSSSDWAGGSGCCAQAWRVARRAVRRITLIAVNSSLAVAAAAWSTSPSWAPSLGPTATMSFTELTI